MGNPIPRIVVGAIQGRSGKTTFTIGLLRALRNRGYHVQPFKKGPDYIDPSWMTMASNTPCRNLDAFMMTREQIRHSLGVYGSKADIAVIEGAMGIFDGLDVEGSNSTAELAYLTESPVILVVSGQRITRSVAALINGVVHFDPRIKIGGVILNQVARPRHENIMRNSIAKYCDVPVLGALPKTKDIQIPDRHLGLIPAGEQEALANRIERLGKLVEDHVDIDALLKIAHQAPDIEVGEPLPLVAKTPDSPTIGVLRDPAFSFYYPENIEALERHGAHVVSINSITDFALPDIDGLYIGGGFPEVMAAELEANKHLRHQLKEKIEAGLPVYAECGGLMYLCRGLEVDGVEHEMVGAFPAVVKMEKKPQGHGYAIQEVATENPYFEKGQTIRGHEFHHSRIVFDDATPENHLLAYQTKRGKGLCEQNGTLVDGLMYKNSLGTYHHFHAATSEKWAENFVKKAQSHHMHKKNLQAI